MSFFGRLCPAMTNGKNGKFGSASWDVAAFVRRVLPAPADPSPASSSHPGRSAEGLMPKAARARIASPPAGTAPSPRALACQPDRVRIMGEPGAAQHRKRVHALLHAYRVWERIRRGHRLLDYLVGARHQCW